MRHRPRDWAERASRWFAALAIVLVATLAPAHAAELRFPELSGRVVDNASLLSVPAEQRLTGWLAELQRAKGIQVVVVTVPGLQGTPIEDYGYQLGRRWGIGEAGRNTGAILLVAPAERTVRIEVGYGLEGTLTDALSRAIIEQDILPAFRQGDFERGILAGTASVLRTLGFEPADAPPPTQVPRAPSQQDSIASLILFGLIVLMLFAGRGRRRGSALPYILAGWAAGSMGRSGSRGGGGFGGGFRGGGGSFGGGGATGRW